jgi:hypothetical protein
VADGSTWVDVTMCRVDPFLSFSLRESPIGLDIEFKMLNQASDLIAQHEAMPADQIERPVAVPVSRDDWICLAHAYAPVAVAGFVTLSACHRRRSPIRQ